MKDGCLAVNYCPEKSISCSSYRSETVPKEARCDRPPKVCGGVFVRKPYRERTTMLPGGRHLSHADSEISGEEMQNWDLTKMRQSRMIRASSINSDRSGARSTTPLDTKQVRLYIKENPSGGSLIGPNGVAVAKLGEDGRPMSGTSVTDLPANEPSLRNRVHIPTQVSNQEDFPVVRSKMNTRIVMPNSGSGRIVPHPQVKKQFSVPNLRRPHSHYLGQLVFQIEEFLYVGGIEAAYNQNMLCKLNVGCVVDVSNVEKSKLPREKRSSCPCLCPQTTPHSRLWLQLSIDENFSSDLIGHFQEVNTHIEQTVAQNKSVLISSYEGKNRCAVFAVQYLMACQKISLERAEKILQECCPKIEIGENFYKPLKKWGEYVAKSRGPDLKRVGQPGAKGSAGLTQLPVRDKRYQAWT